MRYSLPIAVAAPQRRRDLLFTATPGFLFRGLCQARTKHQNAGFFLQATQRPCSGSVVEARIASDMSEATSLSMCSAVCCASNTCIVPSSMESGVPAVPALSAPATGGRRSGRQSSWQDRLGARPGLSTQCPRGTKTEHPSLWERGCHWRRRLLCSEKKFVGLGLDCTCHVRRMPSSGS